MKEKAASHDIQEVENIERTVTTTTNHIREPYLRRILPFHGTFSNDSLFSMIIRPFYVLLNPVVTWSILVVSMTSTWVIVLGFSTAQAFSPPPYNLDATHLGYMSAGPLLGGLIGCIICGFVSDPIVRYMTRKNNGIYEPEFRLPLMICVPIVSTIGYFLFGHIIAEGQSPIAAAAMWGVVFASVQFVGVSTGAYIVDAFRDISVDVFIISMTVKNFVFFGFTCKLYTT
jgi:hypothetical protein